jgi:hypothetical protein
MVLCQIPDEIPDYTRFMFFLYFLFVYEILSFNA